MLGFELVFYQAFLFYFQVVVKKIKKMRMCDGNRTHGVYNTSGNKKNYIK
jgi:hypothetical protein